MRTSMALIIIGLLAICLSCSNVNKQSYGETGSTPSVARAQQNTPQPTQRAAQPAQGVNMSAPDEQAIFEKIKERARRDHPDDYSTQKYVYDTQVEAYHFVKTIPDSSMMRKIQRAHPYDFSTQKYVYETQMEAKEYMDALPSSRLKEYAQRRHPNDYSTQKYIYDTQVEAREAMK